MYYNQIRINRRILQIGNLIILAFAALIFTHCSEGERTTPGSNPISNPNEPVSLSELRQEIALQVADHFILPGYEELANNAAVLDRVIGQLVNQPSPASLQSAREELKTLWLSWQRVSVFQFGPAETNALRVAVNTYPSDSGKIESNIDSGKWNLGSIANLGAEGLPALDYLLNQELRDGGKDLDLLLQDPTRMAYLIALSSELLAKINQTTREWQESSFLNAYTATTSAGTDVGSAIGQLINSIDVHFQRFLRDGKVAIPAGVRSAGIPRPKAVEAYFGGYSRELLESAINAYIDLFEGRGFDGMLGTSLSDYLTAIDQSSIGDDLIAALQNNHTHIQALDNDLVAQIEQDNDQMIDLFIDLQQTLTLIKSDMSSVMGITITNQDNDGD